MPAPVQIMLWVVLALFTLDLGRRMRAARRQVRPPDPANHLDEGDADEPTETSEAGEQAEPGETAAANAPDEPGETG